MKGMNDAILEVLDSLEGEFEALCSRRLEERLRKMIECDYKPFTYGRYIFKFFERQPSLEEFEDILLCSIEECQEPQEINLFWLFKDWQLDRVYKVV